MKKYNARSKWSKIRSINFKIGLSIALLFVLFAFQIDVPDTPRTIPQEIVFDDYALENAAPNHIPKKYIPPVKPKIQEHKKEILDLFNIETVEEEIENDDTLFESSDEEDIIDFTAVNTNKEEDVATKIAPVLEDDTDEILIAAPQMPRFGDCNGYLTEIEHAKCSEKQLLEYIYDKVNYPVQAREIGLEGMVVAQFVINKKGKVTDIKILRDIGGGTKEEVLRLIENMPDWTPGKQNYRPVNVRITLPVRFRLQ